MAKRKVDDIVAEIVKPIIDQNKFELVDVEFVKEGAQWYLKVYIDKPGGIYIDDCEIVSRDLSDLLDKHDPIEISYILEVSSPGLERPLKKDKDFERYKGDIVEVKFFRPVDGKKSIEGELKGLVDNKIVIQDIGTEKLEFERDQVAVVKRVIKF